MQFNLEFATIGPILKKFLDEVDKSFPDKIPEVVDKNAPNEVIIRELFRIKGQREVVSALTNFVNKLQRR